MNIDDSNGARKMADFVLIGLLTDFCFRFAAASEDSMAG